MDGLEKLTGKICGDAKTAADGIFAEAEKLAAAQISDAEKKAAAAAEKILSGADVDAMHIVRGADSQANLDGRKHLLAVRRKMIDAAFDGAQKKLVSLPADEYFELLIKILKKTYNGENAEIVLCAADLKRVTDSFENAVSQLSDGKIKISSEAGAFNGGFILKYGFCEENCSFDAIMRSNREKFEDTAAKILFD